MIKMFSAFTEEIDDVDAAVAEILNQVNADKSLMKNSIGILHCYHEYVDNGVFKAISEKLPFDIIGIAIPYIRMPGRAGFMGCMLNVLTSDDVTFVSGATDIIDVGGANLTQVTEKMCKEVSAKLGDKKPSMLIAYGPFVHMLRINGDDYVNSINACFPGVPTFGSLAFSEVADYSKSYFLYNGEGFEKAAGVIAISGNINPSFLTVSVLPENILGELATVTKSTGNIVNEINGMSFEDYVISIDLIEEKGELMNLYSTPIVAKLDDGSTIIRACIGDDGQGGAIVGGHVPVGAKVSFTMLELSDIKAISEKIAKETLEVFDGRCVMIYSCLARLEFLGLNQREVEADIICNVFGDKVNFFMSYSGGEIFPHKLPDGKYTNNLQNFSIVICML